MLLWPDVNEDMLSQYIKDDANVNVKNCEQLVTRCDNYNSFKVTVLTPTFERPDHVEDIWMSVQYRNFPSFIIGCIYRHPHALNNSFTYLSDVFTSMNLRNKSMLILGDRGREIGQAEENSCYHH